MTYTTLLKRLVPVKENVTLIWLMLKDALPFFKKSKISTMATKEISELKAANQIFRKYRYGKSHVFTNWLDTYKTAVLTALLVTFLIPSILLNIIPTNMCSIFLGYFQTDSPEAFLRIGKVSSLNGVIATIQATMFALIIPMAVALHQFTLQQGEHLKQEVLNFIVKSCRVELVTFSSLALLVAITVTEGMQIWSNDINISFYTILLIILWFLVNLYLILYFMITSLRLINPYERNAAMRNFIVNEIYPKELKSYLKRNIFFSISRGAEE